MTKNVKNLKKNQVVDDQAVAAVVAAAAVAAVAAAAPINQFKVLLGKFNFFKKQYLYPVIQYNSHLTVTVTGHTLQSQYKQKLIPNKTYVCTFVNMYN